MCFPTWFVGLVDAVCSDGSSEAGAQPGPARTQESTAPRPGPLGCALVPALNLPAPEAAHSGWAQSRSPAASPGPGPPEQQTCCGVLSPSRRETGESRAQEGGREPQVVEGGQEGAGE